MNNISKFYLSIFILLILGGLVYFLNYKKEDNLIIKPEESQMVNKQISGSEIAKTKINNPVNAPEIKKEGVSKSPTSNWLTYTSKEDGFSVILPQNPKIRIENDINTYQNVFHEYSASDINSYLFTVNKILKPKVIIGDQDKSLIEYLKSFMLERGFSKDIKFISSNFGYYENRRVLDYIVTDRNEIARIRIIYGEDFYMLGMSYDPNLNNDDAEMYNNFINSLKFFK